MAAKALCEMRPRAVAIAFVREHRAQPLMRGGMLGIGCEGGLVMRARLGVAVGAKQEVRKVDARHRIVRMMQDRFGIDAAGGVDRALAGQPRSEFVERAEMGRMPAQDVDEGCLRLRFSIERPEQRRALDLEHEARLVIAGMRKQRIELGEACFLREARAPGRSRCFGSLLGHGFWRERRFRWRALSLIRSPNEAATPAFQHRCYSLSKVIPMRFS